MDFEQISNEFKEDLYQAVKRKEQETGITLPELIVEFVYNRDNPTGVRLQAIQLVLEVIAGLEVDDTDDDDLLADEEDFADNVIPMNKH